MLPSLDVIVNDLRACSGRLPVLLSSLARNPDSQQQLLTQILELLVTEDDSDVALEWQNLIDASFDAVTEMSKMRSNGGILTFEQLDELAGIKRH